MQKKIYLTKEEQIIISTIQTTEIIDHSHLRELFPTYSPQKINKLCHTLLSKGYLYPLKRGVYLINEIPSSQPVIKNPFRIAPYLNKGYLGFSSALRLYDLLDYEPFTIFTVTPQKSNETTIGNYLFKTIAMGTKATGATFHKDVYVSTIEKTIFDCFYKPQYAGGYQTLTKALIQLKNLNWNQLLSYFNAFATDALFQRTGYLLDLLQQEHLIRLPKTILKECKNHVKTTTKLLPTKPSQGTYSKQWKLLDNIGKGTIIPG